MHLLYVTDGRVDAYMVKALRQAGHVVDATDQPADGVVMVAGGDYQAVVLDWSAPPQDCAKRYAAAGEALLMVIASEGDEAARAAILQAGADACFIRPVQFIELEARLEALARLVQRTRPSGVGAAVEMVVANRTVLLNGQAIALSPSEYHLMEHLVSHPGEVIGLDRLQQQVWGDADEPRPDLVRACVSRLRRKLEKAGARNAVRAVAGHGYVFEPQISALTEA